ncbi:MAG: mechanosensitive ion channel [Chloroflexaceae bacterium]|nr:mechanosensitive ion channel [Chloroflexaceae bacterium]
MPLLEPALLLVVSLLLGIALDKLMLFFLQKRGSLTGWRGDAVFVMALRGMLPFWFTLAGIFLSLPFLRPWLGSDVVDFLPRILQVLFILSLTLFVMRLGVGLIDYSSQGHQSSAMAASLARSLIRITILVVGLMAVLQALEISITPAIAALGITGLAASLALEETLSNAFSGLYLILSKQNQPGDYVRLKIDERDHVEGYITDITWRSTRIRMPARRMTLDNGPTLVNVPNSRMASDIVITYNRLKREKELLVDVSLKHGGDLDSIEQMTLAVAQQVIANLPDGMVVSAPLVRYQALTLDTVDLTVVLYVDEHTDQYLIRHELIKQLYQHYRQAGLGVTVAARPEREFPPSDGE